MNTIEDIFNTVSILTEEIIISYADANQDPSLEKHMHIEDLKKKILEALK